jgi:hypothetical protein
MTLVSIARVVTATWNSWPGVSLFVGLFLFSKQEPLGGKLLAQLIAEGDPTNGRLRKLPPSGSE